MFNNLVESDLHHKETARRSWFFVATLGAYTVLFMIAGVASIYAYDAHLEEQTNEYVVTFVPPVMPAEATPARDSTPRASADNSRRVTERAQPIARINDSTKPPAEISSAPLKVKELPAFGPVAITGRDFDPGTSGMRGTGTGNNNPVAEPPRTVKVDIGEAPPERVAPPPTPKRPVVSKGVLNGKALDLPKPVYSPQAKLVKASGIVTVQVLIDETGKVISAQAVSGHTLLRAAAVQAAYRARFSPTLLSEQPVKVSGVITYNFTL
ncbi:MAG TPA: TonB family protein [Pyrinomonadaceae bacterium]|jgi:TonB family protein|nr:TonB family protein [Pyrinomonadaceae bacterium]